jgi:hypothetical protein
VSPQIEVAALVDGVWVDITPDALGRDKIRITRGRSDWASHVSYAKANLSLKNSEGKYSPRNPLSPYYGKIGRNTPVKVTVDGTVVFTGELAEWPQRAEPDVHVPIEVAGVLRRLSERRAPLRSVMRRTLLQLGDLPTPVAYWPCEDGSTSTALWSALHARRPMSIFEGIQLAAYSGFACSDPIPVLNNTQFYGNVRTYSATTTTVLCLVHFDDDALPANGLSFMVANGTGSGAYWRVQVNIDRTVRLQLGDDDGAVITTSANSAWTVGSAGALIALELTQSGANVNWKITKYESPSPRFTGSGATPPTLSGTINSRTVGRINRVTIGSSFQLGRTAVGHVAVYPDTLPDDPLWAAVDAFVGEPAGRRAERLCDEEAVPFVAVGDLDDTQRMGPQRARQFVDLLEEAADVDGGILYEPPDQLGLAYRTRRSMYNVAAALTLDFEQGQVAFPFEPVDDDQLLRQFGNSVTVTREDGGSYTKTVTTGPMSIQDPPDGVGLYEGTASSFNLYTDDDTALLACWRVFLATWNEQRYPNLAVNLRRHPTLAAAAAATDLGDRITVENPPPWLPPVTIEQQVQGVEIDLDTNLWTMQFNCTPWAPFAAATVGTARVDSLHSTLNESIDATATEFDVVVETGRAMWIRSSEKPALFPFQAYLCVGDLPGEEITITAISDPTLQVQTFTVVRSINGIVRQWDAGTQVRVKDRRYVPW